MSAKNNICSPSSLYNNRLNSLTEDSDRSLSFS